ncbi:MAG TPA: YceI family protein [Cytophagaceae bacterium]|jgi:polyisoprenoid-binding protein YceI|nr:YceI family protein [Cytophagaceae bacterium]
MKKLSILIAIVAITAASSYTILESVNWKVKEDGYSVAFKGGKVNGVAKGLKATILFDEANLAGSSISASIDANSLNTGNGMLNKHAMSETAIDAEKYPTITFLSQSITGGAGSYTAIGKLTLKGVTKEIKLPFTFENKGSEGVFKGSFTVITKEYNITRSGSPESVEVTLSIPVTK